MINEKLMHKCKIAREKFLDKITIATMEYFKDLKKLEEELGEEYLKKDGIQKITKL